MYCLIVLSDYHQSRNKISLRNLSMVLRQVSAMPEETTKNIIESVEKAKEAVKLDITDGQSWCECLNYMYLYTSVVPYQF